MAGRAVIAAVKIFPSIGIARLGNSPSAHFVGPERPGHYVSPADGYKDAACRVKRQAARFRIFGYDRAGRLVSEVTSSQATITWTVHLANRKAEARRFAGLNGNAPRRNTEPIPGVAPVANRADLVIDPGPRSLSGAGQHAAFDSGRFLGVAVPLGDIRTDRRGRLLVLGGFGRSGSPVDLPLTTFANNDRWFDDVSDGPVTATVRFGRSSRVLVAEPAWVICAPPDFAPPVESVTSLYDALFQVFVDKGWLSAPDPPSLTRDVYPVLRRALAIEGTSMMSMGKHGAVFAAAFPQVTLANQADREKVFAKLNNPSSPDVGDADMPMLWSDTYTPGQGETLTEVQYEVLRRWRDGGVIDDWTGSAPGPDRRITPDGLTRAALEACVGGPLYPGIEAGWFLRDTYAYTEPFRLDPVHLVAGDVTKQMAVPWQADFTDCTQDGELAWWPAQRPDDVLPEGSMLQVPWLRDIVGGPDDMVRDWYKLGFVVQRGGQLVETERYKVCRQLIVVAARAELSEDEVAARLRSGAPATFPGCLYVAADGFTAEELGLGVGSATAAQLATAAPIVTLRHPRGRALADVRVRPMAVFLENRTSAAPRQRVTFEYAVELDSCAAFGWPRHRGDVLAATVDVSVESASGIHRASGLFQLARRRGPFVLDGPVPWASADLRLFRIAEGDRRFAIRMTAGVDAATSFIAAVVDKFNGLPAQGHPFDQLSADDTGDPVELARTVDGRRVYDFAVARVRTRLVTPTDDAVRVLFRWLPAASTGTDYDAATTYRRSSSPTAPVALLGSRGGEIVSVPCFASARVDGALASLKTQRDDANARPLAAIEGDEAYAYFGCWLDLNQDVPLFPLHPRRPDGPFTGRRRTAQQLLRGGAVGVVAEIYSGDDPVPAGATPMSHPRLAQRNVAVARLAPAVGPAMATAVLPFAIRATRSNGSRSVGVDGTPAGGELMLLWGDLPDGTEVTLYVPGVSIDALLATAARRYEAARLERVDHHTVRCLPADVTYLPLPAGHEADLAALLSVTVAGHARRNRTHRVVLHQLGGPERRVLGSLGLTIVIGGGRALLEMETRRLSVLRHVASSIPVDDPWRAVSDRQLALLADRVREAGGDPDQIRPSPDGIGTPG